MDGVRIDRDSDLGEDSPMSHNDEHSDREDDIRDCDSSDEGVNVNQQNNTLLSGMDFGRSPEHNSDSHMNQSHLGANHPLGVLSNLSALGVHNLQNLQHGDVLERLKMQVRDMKVGLMDADFALHPNFGGTMQTHSPYNAQNLSSQTSTPNGYPFAPPNAPSHKEGNPGSNSSASSETSNSSQQNNGWSFEEQFKQVRQLYEINDDPKRKEFLDELFQFMQKRGTPINRLPIMAKSVLDLYELYNLVIARGGLVDVINKKLWQEIIKGLHLPSSITSAAFTLRTQYMKYLYPYECEKKNLSSPGELQAAIDGNRREGRRSSYGQFDQQMQTQLQMAQVQRSPIPQNLSQMSPLSLVTHATSHGHHRLMGAPPVGQLPSMVPHEMEQRMLEYIKLFQTPKEPKRNGSQSPEITTRDALNALEMSRVALWNMYNNNTSPPTALQQTSPPDMQREALNLAELPLHHPAAVKREREPPVDYRDERDKEFSMPPAKRGLTITPTSQSHMLNSSLDERSSDASFTSNKENGSSHKHSLNNNNHHNKNHHHPHQRQSSPQPQQQQQQQQQQLQQQKVQHHRSTVKNGTDKAVLREEKAANANVESRATDSFGSGGGGMVVNGMQFKIISRGNAETGDQQLVVTMELNGTQYEGVLFANPIAPTPNDSAALTTAYKESTTKLLQPTPTKNTNNNNSIEDRQQQSQHIQRPLISS